MAYGMYLSAEGAQAMARRMEIVANNLANVNTVGFKRDVPVFHARFAEAIEQGIEPEGAGGIEDIGGGVYMSGTNTDFSRGTLQATGKDTDLAIDGDGFFQVRNGRQVMLTRAGNFSRAADGRLVTAQGHEVLSDAGTPITILDDAGPWTITADGVLDQGGTRTNLALVKPKSLGDLVKSGENLFSPLGRVQQVPPNERNVRSGYLEMSGVNPTRAMLDMIETSRVFEANMKMIQSQDSVTGSLISRVLKS